MAGNVDPRAPMGWCGEDENRRPITYPDPMWEPDVEHAVRTDPAAAWYYKRPWPPNELPPPPPPPPPPSQHQPATLVIPPVPALPPQLAPNPLQQHQQQQQQPTLRQPPTYAPPRPGQHLQRYDRDFGCLWCFWTGDRPRLVDNHLLNQHGVQVGQAQAGVDFVDWGNIKPRYR